MDSLDARYPFLPAAREAVQAADVDLAEVIEREPAVVERARARIENAVDSRTVGDPHRSDRVELLSYPVARVLVSLLDEPALTRRYGSAEAETAIERLRADGNDSTALQSVSTERLSRSAFLSAVGLSDAVSGTDRGTEVDVAAFLRLADGLDGARWRLVNRALDGGRIPVTESELLDLLREAVRTQVEAGLPLGVPEPIEAGLADQVSDLRSLLSDFSVDRSIDAVEPELFPPCVKALAERIADDEPVADHSTFAYVSFLSAIGMDGAEIGARLSGHSDLDDELASYRVDHLTDRDGAAYLPPSCATMQAWGDCVNRDELCARIGHPLEYYERRLDGAEPGATDGGRPGDHGAGDDQASRTESQ